MLEVSRHDWTYREREFRARRAAWIRSLTPAAGLELYEEFHRLAQCGETPARSAERLWRVRREEKLAMRKRMLAVFSDRDHRQRERYDSQNPC